MLFNSITFAIFLPIVFGIYWWLGKKRNAIRLQNVFLLIASYVFYGWWDARFLILIFISSGLDFILGQMMGKRPEKRQRKWMLILSLGVNLGLLGFFKYYGFFVESLISAFAAINITLHAPTLEVLLPVGISFYTFQTLSYSIDVYRGTIKPTKDVVAFFTYVAFFPQLVAGPIEKARDLLPQFRAARRFDYAQAVSGLRLILYGIFKKVVIADRLAEYVSEVFGHAGDYHGLDIVLGALLFTIQVYCDFSGYSDIAIGTARLFGFRLSINFRTPLFSYSIAEFWRRWHISLNAWFRDYVYMPLGGRAPGRRYFNVFVVFLISGIWHGASWGFVIWGFICALFYVSEVAFGWFRKKSALGMMWAFWTFTFSMLFFRSQSISDAFELMTGIAGPGTFDFAIFTAFQSQLDLFLSNTWEIAYLCLLLLTFMAFEARIGLRSLDDIIDRWPRAVRWGFYYVLIFWLLVFGAYGNPQQFVYFQF